MRKIFRMQYEPCTGMCYAWDDSWDKDDDDDSVPSPIDPDGDILPLRALKNNPEKLKEIIGKLVAMHEELCGNKNLRYGIDLCEDSNLFIGSFWHYGKLELFTDKCHIKLLEKMDEFVLPFYKTEAYKKESKYDKGLGHSVCEHGENDNLIRFIIRSSRIETPNGVDAYIRNLGFNLVG
jgi:hypothetical protein